MCVRYLSTVAGKKQNPVDTNVVKRHTHKSSTLLSALVIFNASDHPPTYPQFPMLLRLLLPLFILDGVPGTCETASTLFLSRERSVLEVTSLLGRLLPTLCPETISHFYVGMRPAAHSRAVTAGVFPQAENATICSVPWLFSAMPLPQPVASLDVPYSAANDGEEELGRSSKRSSNGSPGRSPDRPEVEHESRCCGRSPAGGDAGPSVCSDVGTGRTAANDGNASSVRFVCHVEVARLLATTAMGVLGDGGGSSGDKDGEEECARVLEACEAFFAAFERSYCG